MDTESMRAKVQKRFGIVVENRRLWWAMALRKQEVKGSHGESFKILIAIVNY